MSPLESDLRFEMANFSFENEDAVAATRFLQEALLLDPNRAEYQEALLSVLPQDGPC